MKIEYIYIEEKLSREIEYEDSVSNSTLKEQPRYWYNVSQKDD